MNDMTHDQITCDASEALREVEDFIHIIWDEFSQFEREAQQRTPAHEKNSAYEAATHALESVIWRVVCMQETLKKLGENEADGARTFLPACRYSRDLLASSSRSERLAPITVFDDPAFPGEDCTILDATFLDRLRLANVCAIGMVEDLHETLTMDEGLIPVGPDRLERERVAAVDCLYELAKTVIDASGDLPPLPTGPIEG